ncbi:Unknown protein [Striga hermonthica]|uniref:FBD domain-containing protein n=1 Tax=Striga hermonthica TaxID=68872 RepID=A0A9N7R1H3_STRHE|nr:Unknown protein [Striga hermonthica]
MEETKQPSGNCSKLSDREQNMGSIDRLSSLPDEVICHILSFMSTKRSVATSVLGRSWRFIWAHVPYLNFNGDDFHFRKEETQVLDIIHRVILQHKAKRMDTLILCDLNCNEYQLETWITTSIRNLYLQLKFDTIPRSLFISKNIVVLKLGVSCNSRVSLSAMDNVSLPSLKKFHAFRVVCENDDALPHFLSGCPSLVELILEFIFVEKDDYVGCINISSPTIKMLHLIPLVAFGSTVEYRVIINSPALRYLKVDGYDLKWITIPITMTSLVEANIRLKYYKFSNLETNYNSTVVKFLRSLPCVKCLKISGRVFKKFGRRGLGSNVKFDNLTKLELQFNFKWSLLVKFLQVADNLQVLICSRRVYFEEGYLFPESEQVPKCLLSCLRTITFKSMRFSEYEFDMVRYLLRNSRVLERMETFSSPYDIFIGRETRLQAFKRISLFERGSNACQLTFH